LLLGATDHTGGGTGFTQKRDDGRFSISNAGKRCADYEVDSLSDLRDDSHDMDAMQTAIHEIGHNLLLPDPEDNADDFESCDRAGSSGHHVMGNVEAEHTWQGTSYYETPMSNGSAMDCIADGNYCDNSVEVDGESEIDGQSLRFSDCAWSHMAEPSDWD